MPYTAAGREVRIRRYEEGPAKLRAALAKIPPEAMKWRPGPGKWSAHEVACHCADSETVAAMRIRFLIGESRPAIVAYDQAHWAQRFDYHSAPIEPALAAVDAVRAHTGLLLRRLPEDAWSAEGTHSETGRYTAQIWMETYSEHLEKHSRQVDRNLEAWNARAR
jgi:DinB family protein